MTIINPNSIAGITSVTAEAGVMNFYKSDGTLAGLQLNGVNFNTTSGISTFNDVYVGGTITYEDVKNVDSVGIITARGVIDAQGYINLAQKIIHTGDADTSIEFPSNDTIKFETAGGERLRITSTGQISINSTNTPEAQVDIYQSGQSSTTLSMLIGANEGGAGGQGRTNSNAKAARIGCPHYTNAEESLNIVTAYSGATTNNLYWGGGTGVMNSATSHHFYTAANNTTTGGTERLRITSAGVVSINDTTPETFATLQVKNHTGSNAAQFLLHGADMAQIILRDETGGSNTKCTTIRNDQGAFLIGTHNDSYGGFSEKLRITSDGKLGIGVNSPSTAMHLKASDAYFTMQASSSSGNAGILFKDSGGTQNSVILYDFDDDYLKITTNNDTERLRITSGGVLCVGATAASGSEFLRVKNELLVMNTASTGDAFVKIKAGESGGSVLEFQADEGDDNDDYWRIQNAGDGLLGFRTKSSGSWVEKLRIASDGKIGIGGAASHMVHIQHATTPRLVVEDTTNNVQAQIGADNTVARIGTVSNHSVSFRVNDTEKASLNSSGVLAINNGAGASHFQITQASGNTVKFGITSGSNIELSGSSNNDMYFKTNNLERFRITSAGQLQATGGADVRLTLGSSGTAGTNNSIHIRADGADLKFMAASGGDTIFEVNGTETFQITSSSQIKKRQGANVTSLKTYNSNADAFWLDHYQYQSSGTYQRYTDIVSIGDGSWGSNIRFFTNANGSQNGIERCRIDANGGLRINAAGAVSSELFTVQRSNAQVAYFDKTGSADHTTIQCRNRRATGTTYATQMEFRTSNGTAIGYISTHGSNCLFGNNSDYRLKENVVNLSNGITRLKNLKPYRFNFKTTPDETVDGFYAHEASTVVGNAVVGDKDAVNDDGSIKPQAMDNAKLVPLLTAALQEAITKIETLETKVAALESS